jgi:hypothetical protein
VPWVALLVVSSTAAHALEGAVTSPLTLATAVPVTHSTNESVRERAASESPHQMLLTITLRDPTTGRDMPWQCVTTSDRAPMEELVIDANDLPALAMGLCGTS